MVRGVMVAMVCALFLGCVAQGNKKITDPKIVAQVEKGKSSKADVKKLLGDPAAVDFTDAGFEKWVYTYSKATVRGTTFIPIAGSFVGGTDMQTDTLTVQFDKDGTVMNLGGGHTTGGAGGLQDANR